MAFEVGSELARLLSRALRSGVETSVVEMAALMNLADEDALSQAVGVAAFSRSFELQFTPPLNVGELTTRRVLRPGSDSTPAVDIAEILERGEGSTIEFKSSMYCSMRDWAKTGDYVEHPGLCGEILKTICAFMNSSGGDLLVGIDDSGSSCGGILRDIELKNWNLDKWQLALLDLISGRFVESQLVAPFVHLQMVTVEGDPVAHLRVLARENRTFVKRDPNKGVEFFVRNGSRTDSLDLPGFYAHMVALQGSSALDD